MYMILYLLLKIFFCQKVEQFLEKFGKWPVKSDALQAQKTKT